MKTALVGLGRIGWGFHLPKLAQHKDYSPIIAVDTCAERLEEARKTYGVDGYLDYSEMLAKEKPELVVIASPTHLHRQQAIEAFRAGANVFLDKPMAVDLAEAREIAAAAEQYGRKLMVYQPCRLFPEVTAFRRVLESGILGHVFLIKRTRNSFSRRNDWQAFKKFGGGMLNNYGAHHIDELLYLTGANVTDIACHRRREVCLGDADDVVKILMNTADDLTLDLEINLAAAIPAPPWQIFGTLGAATLEQGETGGEIVVRYLIPEELPALEASDSLTAKDRKYSQDGVLPWHTERFPVRKEDAVDIYAAILPFFAGDQPPLIPVGDTLRVMEIIHHCYELTPGV